MNIQIAMVDLSRNAAGENKLDLDSADQSVYVVELLGTADEHATAPESEEVEGSDLDGTLAAVLGSIERWAERTVVLRSHEDMLLDAVERINEDNVIAYGLVESLFKAVDSLKARVLVLESLGGVETPAVLPGTAGADGQADGLTLKRARRADQINTRLWDARAENAGLSDDSRGSASNKEEN